jgi:hypothetical protein
MTISGIYCIRGPIISLAYVYHLILKCLTDNSMTWVHRNTASHDEAMHDGHIS